MADPLLDAAIAAETELAQARDMLALLKNSADVPPDDLRAAESEVAAKRQACQDAYQAHATANPNEPFYEVDQDGLHRLSPDKVQAHRDRWAAGDAELQKWKVPKEVVVERLIDAGKASAFMTALNADPARRLRFEALHAVPNTNPWILAILNAIDADPAVILEKP